MSYLKKEWGIPEANGAPSRSIAAADEVANTNEDEQTDEASASTEEEQSSETCFQDEAPETTDVQEDAADEDPDQSSQSDSLACEPDPDQTWKTRHPNPNSVARKLWRL